MKYLILIISLVNFGLAQTVINAIPAPANASGLCWDGQYLWCGAYGVNGDTLYKINPTNGTILKRFKWHSNSNADCYGLAFDTINNGSLWVLSHYSATAVGDSIFLVDTINGAYIRAIRAKTRYMAGLANDGQHLWHCAYYQPDGRAYHINKYTGVVFDSIDIPSLPQPWGATWDGQFLWVCNDGNFGGTHSVYKINVNTHQIIDSFASPGTRPFGLAWDGIYMWVLANGPSPTGKVAYQIDLGGVGTPDISVSPTSYNYGYVAIGQSPWFELHISNVGTDTLTLDTIFSNNPVFYYQTTTFPIRLRPNFGVQVQVYFSPTAFQFYTGTLGIVSNDPDEETVYVSLRGQGVYPMPTLSASAISYNFGDVRVNYVKDWFLRIVNQGLPTLIIDSIIYNDNQFFTGRISLPLSLNCLETTFVQVITRPNSTGTQNGFMMIYSNSTPNPYGINLYVNGVLVSPTGGELLWSYDFPDNVVCVAPIVDINGDSVVDVAAECYGTNMSGEKHLRTYWGNSFAGGVVQWAVGDVDFSGSWGDDCLIQGDDYNNDGVPDILLGTAWGDRSVYAINSLNGQIIWYYDSHWYDGEGGWVYSVRPMPDINGDGIGEVLAGIGGNQTAAGGPRSIFCFNGATGAVIWQYRALDAIGTVNWIPDVNNDGVPDAICGAWGNSYDKKVYCISGASSGFVTTPLWQYQCDGDVQSVIPIPDINGDGKYEVVAGAWDGVVRCLSGANGNLLWATTVGGWVVRLVAIPNLIAPNRPGIAVANVYNVTTFRVLNSNNGSIYWEYPIGSNIWAVDVIEDLNSDGKYDVVCGNQTPGMVFCLSGANGNLLWSYAENKLIYSIRAITDISGDGHQDVIVGTQGATTGVGHLLAICGGYYPSAISENHISEIKNIAKFSVLPRISSGVFNINWKNLSVKKITIFDASGKLVKEFISPNNRVIWDGKDNHNRVVAEGIYFVKVQAQDYNHIEKIIVVK
ncbi:MAG: choice-of-anchor D domain-containing protein [candidate division WOR-3 bacterium]